MLNVQAIQGAKQNVCVNVDVNVNSKMGVSMGKGVNVFKAGRKYAAGIYNGVLTRSEEKVNSLFLNTVCLMYPNLIWNSLCLKLALNS